ncbi:hypothetical protein BGZ99_004337 [Dissophora globulifera]|uniref:AB hydrolase-1 domain-containing protein n=1 Tax=Dissophora globulifera TaxID=979702 RepID=A0A9P6RMS0_9FUNG|nr:hypothetical protein BGZ99_004337 [Dissophora globulifera]
MLDYVEEGDSKAEPLLLVHGFPDHWFGWRHQIKFLAKLGYRVIVVDCLGYGQTDAPMELHKYGMKSVCADLAGLLDALQIPKVTLIGHDWGGALVWRFGLWFPHRLHGIIRLTTKPSTPIDTSSSLCTPFNPPTTQYRSLEEITKIVPEFEYQLNLADPGTVARMDEKAKQFLDSIMDAGNMNQEDLDYMLEQYRIHGFRGPLNYYKTTRINYDDEIGLRNTIDLPCWIVVAENDPYLRPRMARKMKNFMPQLKMTTIVSGHFLMTEKPDEVNALLKQCLDDLLVRRSKASL